MSKIGGDFAVGIEGGVEASVGVISHDCKVRAIVGSSEDDLAIGLDQNRSRPVVTVVVNVGGDFAVCVECGVEASVGVVSHDREVI
ncbi:unannotated protein [freshwater metagenome]|uniref:Unannotated protein n=1 Tax=freshwater metagenome TaxID=449393 RepID=A0A6J6L1C3_9ZZZZ